jgi:hypothetical protein
LLELQKTTGIPAREILQRGLLTPDVIRGTPDFSTMLQAGENRRILEAAGYGDKVAGLKPYKWPGAPSLSLAEQNELSKTAARLEAVGAARGREAAAKQFLLGPRRPDSAFVYQTQEVVTDPRIGHLPGLRPGTLGKKEFLTSRVKSAFTDPGGMDILHRNLGLETIATRAMQGAWRPSPRHRIEYNPGYAAGVEVPLTRAGRIPKRVEQKLRTAAAVRGAMTAQLASPYSGMVPAKRGTDLFIPAEGKLSRADIGKYVRKYGLEDAAVADYGRGAGLLNWTGKPYPTQTATDIGALLGAKASPRRARNVADPNMSYFDLESEWLKAPGSRAVTHRMMDELGKLSKADFKAIDQKNIRQAAGDIHKLYASKAKKGEPVRADLMNLLATVRDKGFAGLRKALRSNSAFLPTLAAIGLAPTLYRISRPADSRDGA